jgi:hypothetical protein
MFYSKFVFVLKPAVKEPEELKGDALWKFVQSESSVTVFLQKRAEGYICSINFMFLKK